MPIAMTQEQQALQASLRDWAKRAGPIAVIRARQDVTALMNDVAGRSHRSQDLIGRLVSAYVAKSARQPSGHYRAAAIQEPSQEVGGFLNHRQGCPQVVRMIVELAWRTCN